MSADDNAPSEELPTTASRRLKVDMSLEREVEGLEREVEDIKRRLKEGDRQLANLRSRDEGLSADISKAERELERQIERDLAKVRAELEAAIQVAHDAASPRVTWYRMLAIVLVMILPIVISIGSAIWVASRYPDRESFSDHENRLRILEGVPVPHGGKP